MWCLRVAKYVSGASKLHRSVQTKHCCKGEAQGEFQPLSILPLSGIILLLPGLSWRKARSHVLDPASQLHRCLSFLWVHILPSWNSTDLCGFLVCLLSRTISPLSSSALFSCISLLFLSLKIAHNPLKFLPIRLFFFQWSFRQSLLPLLEFSSGALSFSASSPDKSFQEPHHQQVCGHLFRYNFSWPSLSLEHHRARTKSGSL